MKAAKLTMAGALACLLGLAVIWGFGSLTARPVNFAVTAAAPPAQVIALQSLDGVPLEATYWPGRTRDGPAILLLHGINASREMFNDDGEWLSALGYAVLAVDFRGHGGSGGAERTFGWWESNDARAGLDFLRKAAPARRIGVIGVSMGGAAALVGSSGPLAADALVLNAVYPDLRTAIWNRLGRSGMPVLASMVEPLLSYQSYLRYGIAPDRIAPREGLKRFKGALLVIGGSEDLATTPADTRSLYAAAPGPKSLWLVQGADHVEVSKLNSDAYRSRVRSFFARALGEPRHARASSAS